MSHDAASPRKVLFAARASNRAALPRQVTSAPRDPLGMQLSYVAPSICQRWPSVHTSYCKHRQAGALPQRLWHLCGRKCRRPSDRVFYSALSSNYRLRSFPYLPSLYFRFLS